MEGGTARGGTSPSEGGVEVLGVGKAHGERCKARAEMHVRFACNLTVNPLYPKPCLFTPPHQSNNVPVLAGVMPVNSEVCFSHQMSERRIGGGLPLKTETPAHEWRLHAHIIEKTQSVSALHRAHLWVSRGGRHVHAVW